MEDFSLYEMFILGAGVVFLAVRLRGMLGKRKVAPEAEDPVKKKVVATEEEQELKVLRGLNIEGRLYVEILKLATRYPSFKVSSFVAKAAQAIEETIVSFSSGKVKLLEELCTPSLLKKFLVDINARATKKSAAETEVVGVKLLKLEDIATIKKQVVITLDYEIRTIKYFRDSQGKIIQNKNDQVRQSKSRWLFASSLGARNEQLNWKIASVAPIK